MKDDSRLAWGISLLIFGFLFLLRQLGVFPEAVNEVIFNWRNLPLVIGVIFLFAHKNKSIGIVLIVIGLLLYLKDIIVWTKTLSELIWPLLLIGAGAIIIASTRTKKEDKPQNTEITKSEGNHETNP